MGSHSLSLLPPHLHTHLTHTPPHIPTMEQTGTQETVISVKDLSKRYTLKDREEDVVALRSIQLHDESEFFSIKRGEFVMLRGPSGGGKTTLLNMLGTIDKPSTGAVEILGNEITAESKDSFLAKLRLEKIGFVFQTFNLLSSMSAYENVELPMTLLGKLSKSERRKRAIMLLTWVGLGDRLNHLPSELSGGEQQRVTIARALANSPEILLLDEPTGDLDTANTISIMDLLLKINQETSVTCVMVSHNQDLECYASRLLYLQDGSFHAQALNAVQIPLIYEDYIAYLNSNEHA